MDSSDGSVQFWPQTCRRGKASKFQILLFFVLTNNSIISFQLLLQAAPNTLDLDAVNIRGQMAEGDHEIQLKTHPIGIIKHS